MNFFYGCSMSEEIKRIDAANRVIKDQEASRSTNLTGEQLFVRSCNTCHPGGKENIGPSLDKLDEHFPEDSQLKSLIRSGQGAMPAQPPDTINDAELDNLVRYLRVLTKTLNEK